MACIVMACIGMADIVMAYTVMAYIVMAYTRIGGDQRGAQTCASDPCVGDVPKTRVATGPATASGTDKAAPALLGERAFQTFSQRWDRRLRGRADAERSAQWRLELGRGPVIGPLWRL